MTDLPCLLLSVESTPAARTSRRPTGDALVNLLKYVVGAAAGSGDLTNGQALTTLDTATASKLTVDLTNGVKLKDSTTTEAKVGPANILAKNGGIHVVDKVLLPQ